MTAIRGASFSMIRPLRYHACSIVRGSLERNGRAMGIGDGSRKRESPIVECGFGTNADMRDGNNRRLFGFDADANGIVLAIAERRCLERIEQNVQQRLSQQ